MQIGDDIKKMKQQPELLEYGDDIIRAIHLMYEDEPMTEINCYRYLSRLDDSTNVFRKIYAQTLMQNAFDVLNEMQICPTCGERLSRQRVVDRYDEFGPVYVDVLYCPQCGEVLE